MAKIKRRQHIVSKFYLSGFANGTKRVMQIRLAGGNPQPISITDATVISHFYTVTLPDGTRSDAFEDAMSELERAAATSLRRILSGTWPLPTADREAVASWIALQYLRTAAVRRTFQELSDFLTDLALRTEVAGGGKDRLRTVLQEIDGVSPTEEDVEFWWDDLTAGKPQPGPTIDPADHLQQIIRQHRDSTLMMRARPWTLIRFRRKALITGDCPVVLLDDGAVVGAGYALAPTVLVPLDRRTALLLSEVAAGVPEGEADVQIAPTAAMARVFNQAIASNAYAAVFHHPDDDPLTGLSLPPPMRSRAGLPDLPLDDEDDAEADPVI
ncbi:DUF4238 domain-containing protein [Catenulispora subtropica]